VLSVVRKYGAGFCGLCGFLNEIKVTGGE